MSILTYLTRLYAGFRKRSYERNWDHDFKIHLKTHEEPFDFAGLELALLHLKKVSVIEPSAQLRRTLTLHVATPTVEHLLSLLALARIYVGQRDSMPQDFLSSEDVRPRTYDDYFISKEGHIVSIEKIRSSIEGRLTQLIAMMRLLETEQDITYAYFSRKLRPLFSDTFYVLQAIHETSFR